MTTIVVWGVMRRGHRSRIHLAVSVNRQDGHLEAMPLQAGAGAQHRPVLDRGGDEVPSLGARRPGQARDGQVRVLGRAAGEHDLARLGTQRRGDLLAGIIQALPRSATDGMQARRVPEMLGEVREHGFEDLGPQRRGRGVVEVDGHGRGRLCPTGSDRPQSAGPPRAGEYR